MSNKKSFEFRMSKKVAELTQVVHMLFTRNHEKEVELEALRGAYEHEISLVISDARAQLDSTEARMRDMQLERSAGDTKHKAELDKVMSERDSYWRQKVGELESQVKDEKRECQNSRDLLIKAQQDIERLKGSQNEDTSRLSKESNEKTKEIERLRSVIKNLELNLNDKQHKLASLGQLEKTQETLRKELEHYKESLKTSDKVKEQILAKNKSLENDLRHLKRELNRKSAEKPGTAAQGASVSSGSLDYGDELERLRREIQRYRNELSNRETNFNRMFVDKKPVNMNGGERRGATPKSKSGGSPAFENGIVMRIARERSSLDSAYQREKSVMGDLQRERTSMSYGGNNINKSLHDVSREDFLEQMDIKTKPSSPGQPQNRLPSLPSSSDPTSRLQKLMKPKPLPRELLSSKH